ncbi:hypothetical protein CLV86_0135 [Lacinutrix venerupis]|uniref:pirin family protein n=1 Tax=Lacinutrix venerupis TaxID=1486034 RepID=UPI000EAFE771|nr:pirin family protein [Lacinutrix venerupis]RLJ68746.1 hypothetical protein CLV86_0135 [Lacinutrix venerupis]
MKLVLHKADSRGFANHGWLQANYSFSFANYYNENKMHFGALRVLNDDVIAPKMGFGMHPHNNMEIISIPLKGILKHKDNMHKQWQEVKTGEVQIMSAGIGVEHSEINGSVDEHLNLFQIWIIPNKENVTPRYDQKLFNENERKNKLQTLVSSIDEDKSGSLKIHQDARISRINLNEKNSFTYTIKSKNHGVYVMNIYGEFILDSKTLKTRDAIEVSETNSFEITAKATSEILFIEVPLNF